LLNQEETPLFAQYAELIGLDMGVAIRTKEDLEEIFMSLVDQVKSARLKLAPVKKSRWFSWHQCCHDQIREFWTMRMLLAHEFGDLNLDEELRVWTAPESGGMKLALRCTTWSTWVTTKVLELGGQPLWSWYTKFIEDVKTPHDGFNRTLSLIEDKWLSDEQFRNLAKVLSDVEQITKVNKYMEHLGADSPCNMDSFVDQLYFYVLSLLEKRACSASKMNCGPEAYAGLLSHDAEQAQRALDLMMSDWKALVLLEQSQTNQLIAGDLRIAIPPVMRVIFQLCEQGFHDQARELLKPILVTFPDTKCIEDIHGVIRNDARLNINKRQTFAQVQRCILGSSALESREVPHPVALTKNVFKRRWKRTRGGLSWKVQFNAKAEKLPRKHSVLLGEKKWQTISEDTLQRSSAAWQVVRFYMKFNLRQRRLALCVHWLENDV
jgi:uncharacterized protein (DUF1499 family)